MARGMQDLPATASGIITFGCLNNFCKVNDDCLALWARVVPRTVGSSARILPGSGRRNQI
jgi:predicted O-linked N-acetylglucosamine transferase (SPINDLY family)